MRALISNSKAGQRHARAVAVVASCPALLAPGFSRVFVPESDPAVLTAFGMPCRKSLKRFPEPHSNDTRLKPGAHEAVAARRVPSPCRNTSWCSLRPALRVGSWSLGLLSLFFTFLFSGVSRAEIVYEKHIAPILRAYCSGCHNADEHEAEFSVETFASLLKGGSEKGAPIKPGQPEDSFLIKSLESRARPHMPPKDEPQVPAVELVLLKQWIASGAPGPQRDESILQNLVVPPIKTARGQRQPVTAAAYSPDGKFIAVAVSGRVEIRSSPRGKARRVLSGLPGKINAVHFSPDGRQLIAAGGITGLRGAALLWDVESGQVVREFGGHRDALYDAERSPDGRTLATAGYDRVIRLWNPGDGKLLRSIAGHNGAVFDLAFDPSGTVLASASADQTVKLWRVADGVRLDTLNQPQGELNAATFTPDGEYILAAGNDRRIHLWRFVSKTAPALNPVVHSRFAHEAAITAFSLSTDARHLITAAADRTLKLWSLPDLTERSAYDVQPDLAAVLVARPRHDEFLAARLDGSVQVYESKSAPTPRSAGLRPGERTQRAGSETGAPRANQTNVVRFTEAEPNDTSAQAVLVNWPVEIQGTIARPGDPDLYRFRARAGQELTLAVNAAQSKSPLDSRLEVLAADGHPVEQVVLQAVRDSWFTFRGKDSDTADDFRLHNWAEMELDEYLYANGEVTRLWLYPRGPDSGYKVYPGEGKRHAAFGTTALTHALNEPCYIVTPLRAGARPVPNGLPVFRLNCENDDDSSRRAGADSLLLFTAPANGDYLVRLTDVRGFGGTNSHYTLAVRERRPDFSVAIEGKDPKISPGSGREISFVAQRMEGFDGPIHIDITNLPAGFTASTPVEIEAGQIRAVAALYAAPDAAAPGTNAGRVVKIVARAQINGREVVHESGTLGDLGLAKPAKVTVHILPGKDRASVKETAGRPLEFSIRPGQTISARVRTVRHEFKERIELGGEDSGRNLPHGVYVDNIGLNGLLIVEGQTEREFFITASKVTKPGTRMFHLRAKPDGGQVSEPVILHVLPPLPAATAARRKM